MKDRKLNSIKLDDLDIIEIKHLKGTAVLEYVQSSRPDAPRIWLGVLLDYLHAKGWVILKREVVEEIYNENFRLKESKDENI